jgi:hypothetical protein
MSSMLRGFPDIKQGLTRFVKPDSPSYDEDGVTRLFPFSYLNGVLDISYSGNTFEATNVTTVNVAPDAEAEVSIDILGGPFLVTSLGDNFKAYIRAWRDGTIDAGSPIEIFINPQILRVQEAADYNVTALSGQSYIVSTKAPVSDFYTAGEVANKYYTTYVFKTPLTFTIIEGGVKQYITFTTHLDQE